MIILFLYIYFFNEVARIICQNRLVRWVYSQRGYVQLVIRTVPRQPWLNQLIGNLQSLV